MLVGVEVVVELELEVLVGVEAVEGFVWEVVEVGKVVEVVLVKVVVVIMEESYGGVRSQHG